jgi:type I restriction-modification system DNA methylase subunit
MFKLMNEHKKNIIKLIEQASYRHSAWQVFSDFVELSALSISNSVDKRYYKERETIYLEVIKKYDRKEGELFPKMFGELILALEIEMTDILGEIFMEMELGSKWKGQFFTPMSVCRATAKLSLGNIGELIEQKGFVTVSEPACGGGALVIAFAEALRDRKLNYQQTMVVEAVDLDIKAVHMSYLQLSLLGIPAKVFHGNTLSMEMYSEWRTPTYILGGWWYKKQKEQKPKASTVELQLEENGQYSMFNLVS